MYEKKNKLSQPPILSYTVYRNNINEKSSFFFKTLTFDGCLAKYRLYMPFRNNIRRCLYVLEYALPTPPLGYCFVGLKYVSIIHLWTIFFKAISARKSSSWRSISDKFIWSDKQKIQNFVTFGHCLKTIKTLLALGSSATQDTRVLEALWQLNYFSTSALGTLYSVDSKVLH